MLLGNFNIFNANPGRAIGGPSDPTLWRKPGTVRQFYFQDSTNNFSKSSFPNGYKPPYTWILAPVGGGMSSNVNGSVILNSISAGSLDAVKAMVGALSASGGLTGTAGLIVNMIGALIAGGLISNAALISAAQMTADLAAEGSIVSALTALGWLVSEINASGELTAVNYAVGHMSADIIPYTELSPESLASAVWNKLASEANSSGSMGEKLNDAGSASNPWTENLPGSYIAGQAGYVVGTNLDAKVSEAGSGTMTEETIAAEVLSGIKTPVLLVDGEIIVSVGGTFTPPVIPDAPVIYSVNGSTSSPASGDDDTPSVVINSVQDGDSVKVYDTSSQVASGTASGTSITLSTSALSEAQHTLRAKITRDGQTSSYSNSFLYTYSVVAPPDAPTIYSVAGDTSSPADEDDPTPDVVINDVQVDDLVSLYVDGVFDVSDTAVGTSITLTASTLAEDTFSLTATITRDALESDPSTAFEYTYTAPVGLSKRTATGNAEYGLYGGYYASMACDGSESTHAYGRVEVTLIFDLGSSLEVSEYKLLPTEYVTPAGTGVKTFNLWAGDTTSANTYHVITDEVVPNTTPTPTWHTYDFGGVTARYWKIIVSDSYCDNGEYQEAVTENEFWG